MTKKDKIRNRYVREMAKTAKLENKVRGMRFRCYGRKRREGRRSRRKRNTRGGGAR